MCFFLVFKLLHTHAIYFCTHVIFAVCFVKKITHFTKKQKEKMKEKPKKRVEFMTTNPGVDRKISMNEVQGMNCLCNCLLFWNATIINRCALCIYLSFSSCLYSRVNLLFDHDNAFQIQCDLKSWIKNAPSWFWLSGQSFIHE